MEKTNFMGIYPVYSLDLPKNRITQKSVNELVDYFVAKIEENKIAVLLSVFDQYEHTTSIGGEINPDIKAAINIVFGFCPKIPNTKVMAVRPRSIGVCELEDKFVIDFIEAPAKKFQDLMVNWTEDLLQ